MDTCTYDPFGWRLDELARPDLDPARRAEVLDDLLVAEAEELAHGRRHLTIVHGEPADIAEAEALNDFYDAVEFIASSAEWSRLSGTSEFLTVTLAGHHREELLATVADLSRRTGADRWRILIGPDLVGLHSRSWPL